MKRFEQFDSPLTGAGAEASGEDQYKDLVHDALLALDGKDFASEDERVAAAVAKLSAAEEAAALIGDPKKRAEALATVRSKQREIEKLSSVPLRRTKR